MQSLYDLVTSAYQVAQEQAPQGRIASFLISGSGQHASEEPSWFLLHARYEHSSSNLRMIELMVENRHPFERQDVASLISEIRKPDFLNVAQLDRQTRKTAFTFSLERTGPLLKAEMHRPSSAASSSIPERRLYGQLPSVLGVHFNEMQHRGYYLCSSFPTERISAVYQWQQNNHLSMSIRLYGDTEGLAIHDTGFSFNQRITNPSEQGGSQWTKRMDVLYNALMPSLKAYVAASPFQVGSIIVFTDKNRVRSLGAALDRGTLRDKVQAAYDWLARTPATEAINGSFSIPKQH